MSKKYGNHLIYLSVVTVFLLSFAAFYGIYGDQRPLFKPETFVQGAAKGVKPTIRPDTVIRKEIRYLCGDRVSTRIPTTSDLVGLDFASLVSKYPPEAGWSIDDTVKNTLVLARMEQRVCPYHQDFRHLGIHDGFLAVYEGPLGHDYKVLQREDINVSSLPPEIQEDLKMAMDYNNQIPDTQGRLKLLYEFETDAQLNSVLENFDEFKG